MELVQEAILGLGDEMKSFQEEGVALEKQRQILLTHLEEKMATTETETRTIEEKTEGAIKVLHQLKSGINYTDSLYCYMYTIVH